MAIKVYGDKIVFPDSTEQTTASTQLDGYDKAEIDAQQKEQDDKIQANTDAIEVNAEEIEDKVSEAPVDGKSYARKNKDWHEVEASTGSYTKDEIDAQQEAQDNAIADNATNIATNTTDIATNATAIAKNKTDIEALVDDVDALTGSVIYKGSLNATVTPAPADAVVGDMYINEYNVSEPGTNYPVASGWSPVTEVKYDDKLIKTDTGWDLIASVVGVPSYTAGEIDALLDDKADKGDSYLKSESDSKNDAQDTAIQENKDAIASIPTSVDTYTKDEIDAQQILQDDEIQANKDAIADLPAPVDAYTKTESDAKNEAQDTAIQANADAIDALPSSDDYYNKTEVDALQKIQDDVIDFKADKGDSYTKSEADDSQALQDVQIASKADVGDSYTKTESDILLDNKANKSDTYTKSETYSSVEVDGELFKKADKDTTYTKTEVDDSQALQNTEIAKKQDTGVSYTKAENDTLLNKKADKTTTYTKDEVDDLLAIDSNDIVGNYTNKWASSVPRDPSAGNLYLVNGVNFTTDYNDVTSIYISDTDGDGDVRDFDEVVVGDKVVLTSVDGTGEYTVVTITDVGGYRELVVNTESATGTIDDDTPVSIVLYVASSGETGGGIEEAPKDGKQYARQDGDWSEVEASGGSTPTPEDLVWEDVKAEREFDKTYTNDNDVPLYVAVDFRTSNSQAQSYVQLIVDNVLQITSGSASDQINANLNLFYIIPAKSKYLFRESESGKNTLTRWHEAKMPLAIAVGGASSGGEAQPPVAFSVQNTESQPLVTTENTQAEYNKIDLDNNSAFDLTNNHYVVPQSGVMNLHASVLMVSEDFKFGYGYIRIYKNDEVVGITHINPSDADKNLRSVLFPITATVEVEKGDELYVKISQVGTGVIRTSSLGNTFSGHMVSSITEGSVSEKEAVVVKAKVKDSDAIPQTTWTRVKFTEVDWNDKDNFDVTNHCYIPKVEGYYQVNCGLGVDKKSITSLFRIMTNDSESFRSSHTESNANGVGSTTTGSGIVYCNGVDTKIAVDAWVSEDTTFNTNRTVFSAHLITGQSTGGGSGGGDYTPEKMVWEDKTSERELDKVYTNDNDVPLYVQINSYTEGEGSTENWKFEIDGDSMGWNGTNTLAETNQTPLFIVPAGKKYKAVLGTNNGTVSLLKWHEAKMPVAVGTGDSIWTDVDGDAVLETDGKKLTIDANVAELGAKARITTDTGALELKVGSGGIADVTIADTGLSTVTDMTVNGVTVGTGSGTGVQNTAVGGNSLKNNIDGLRNTAVGFASGNTLTTGQNNIFIGYNAQPSSTTVSNEVTIGDDNVTKTRLKGELDVKKNTIGTYATFTGSSDGGRGLEFVSADVDKTGSGGLLYSGASHTINASSGQGQLTFSIANLEAMHINNLQEVSTVRDMTVNGVTVGSEGGTSYITANNKQVLRMLDKSTQIDARENLYLETAGVTRIHLLADGRIKFVVNDTGSANVKNLVIDANGFIYAKDATTYTIEEVDDKLAKMQKVIDSLEKKLK